MDTKLTNLISLIAFAIGLLLTFFGKKVLGYCGGMFIIIAFLVQLFNIRLWKQNGSNKISSNSSKIITSDEDLKQKISQGITKIGSGKEYSNLKHEMSVIICLPDHVESLFSSVQLENFPNDLGLSPELKDKIHHNISNKVLTFDGVMTDKERQELLGAAPGDEKYQSAIKILYQSSIEKGLIFIPRNGFVTRPEVFEAVRDKIIEEIKDIKFDLLCGLSNSGDCLVSAIETIIRKPSITCDQESTNFLPFNLRSGEKLILIDAVMQTGGVFSKCKEQARLCGAEVVKFISVIDNNMLDQKRQHKREEYQIDLLLKKRTISCLYKMTDLYQTYWKDDLEEKGTTSEQRQKATSLHTEVQVG